MPTIPRDPALDALDRRLAAAPAAEAARLDLAADLQRRGLADVAAVVGGPKGAGVARLAAAAGVSPLAAAECLAGRVGWAEMGPDHTAAVMALLAHREAAAERARAAIVAAVDQTAAAVDAAHAALTKAGGAVERAFGRSAGGRDLRAAADRLDAAAGAVGRLLAAAAPLYGMAEGARAELAEAAGRRADTTGV